jgi:uncharacterized membrane protein
MTRHIYAETTRSPPVRHVAALMIAAVTITGMIGASARAEDRHDGGNRGGDHRDGGPRGGGHWGGGDRGDRGYSGYSGGYYSPPPVVYGSPYDYPPPVVYGPTLGIAIPGINIGIR